MAKIGQMRHKCEKCVINKKMCHKNNITLFYGTFYIICYN